MSDTTTFRAVTGFLAGARSAASTRVFTARQVGDQVAAADARTSVADLRAAIALHVGVPVAVVHRDGWRLETVEARAYFAGYEAAYRGETPR